MDGLEHTSRGPALEPRSSEPTTSATDVRVVFIAGYARCGSTLLERLLGQVKGIESFGELRHVWFRSFQDNQLCGCGVPFRACPFWRDVVERAFGRLGAADAKEITRNKRWVDNPLSIPRVLTGGWTPAFRRRMAFHAARLRALYSAISDVSGAEYLVDASKDPQHAYILRSIPGFDVRVVHLIRDSRAVAFSWRRVRRRPEIHWEGRDMPRYAVTRTALAWSLTNLASEIAPKLGLPYVQVRYEDLVADTRGELSRILERLGLGAPSLAFLSDGAAQLRPAHTVSGNPMRFSVGELLIREDDEWIHRMSSPDRRVVTAITMPLLKRYGYSASPRAAGEPRARSA
jgi:hypothetical protein